MHLREEMLFSEWIESVRKSVECFFGILKGRFRFLRNAIRCRTMKVISDAVRTCCVLHNMLLDFNKQGNRAEEDWENLDPEAEDPVQNDAPVSSASGSRGSQSDSERSAEPLHCDDPLVTVRVPFAEKNFHLLKESLMSHFIFQYAQGKVKWPKSKNPTVLNQVVSKVLGRVDIFVKSIFQIKESGLKAKDASGVARFPIGNGLFARRGFYPDEDVITFVGEYIDEAEKKRREKAKLLGYMIAVTQDVYLDCKSHCEAMVCYASYANDPFNCIDQRTGKDAKENCKLVVDQRTKTCRLRCTRRIVRGDEILWQYDPNGHFFNGYYKSGKK